MICVICGCFFCNDAADKIITGACDKCRSSTSGRKGAGAKERHKIKRQVRQRRRTRDHERGKVHYWTEQKALEVLPTMGWYENAVASGKTPGVYWCCSAGWLITSDISLKSIPDGAEIGVLSPKEKEYKHNPVLPENLARELLRQLGDTGED